MTVWMSEPRTDEVALDDDALAKLNARRQWIKTAASGAILTALAGGSYILSDSATARARAQTRPDGRPRLPPGQRVLSQLKPMGGQAGDPRPSAYRLRIHGEVDSPLTLDLAALMALGAVELALDVHCVTGWSVLGAKFKGVRLTELAKKAGLRPSARYAIFEAAHGYTANAPIREALDPEVLVAWELDGQRLPRAHGAPVRAVNPNLYFWKSPKWLTGVRFVSRDEPGYWEQRGYHNHADPWKEERYG
jgi:DMSO/TMAO reductase YedYZ molybdopterin-dependent catalytic subunit